MHQNTSKQLYKTSDRNFYLLIIIIAIFGLFLRWHDVGKHQSQNDEWAAAWHITEVKNRTFENYYEIKINELTSNNFDKKLKNKIALKLKDNQNLLINVLKFNDFLKLSGGSTISPMMFYVGYFLISGEENNYENLISKLKKISIFYYILSFILFYRLFEKNNFFNNKSSFIFFLIITVFSFENILFNRQFFNYSYSIVIFPILFLNIYKVDIRKIVVNYFSLLFCILTSYQTFFLLPAYFIAKFYKIYSDKEKKISLFIEFTLALLTVFLFYYFFLRDGAQNLAINWNSGFHNEFIFSHDKLKNNFVYLFSFFFQNFFVNIGNLTSFFEISNSFFIISSTLFSLLFIIGFFTLLTSQKINLDFKIFIVFNFAVFIIFIILRLLSFSPTRHLIFYLPSVAIVISLGLSHLYVSNTFKIKTLTIFILLVFSITYFSANQLKNRKNPYNEDLLLKILKKNNIEKIIVENGLGPIYFSKKIRENYEIFMSKHGSNERINIGKSLPYNLKKNIMIINFNEKIDENKLLKKYNYLNEYDLILDVWIESKFKSELYQNIDAYNNSIHYLIYKY